MGNQPDFLSVDNEMASMLQAIDFYIRNIGIGIFELLL